jgi:hypothetical protein
MRQLGFVDAELTKESFIRAAYKPMKLKNKAGIVLDIQQELCGGETKRHKGR